MILVATGCFESYKFNYTDECGSATPGWNLGEAQLLRYDVKIISAQTTRSSTALSAGT